MNTDPLRSDPSEAASARDAAADAALRRQLGAMAPPASDVDIEALNRRVLAQWRAQHLPQRAPGAAVLTAGNAGGRWLAASAGLVLCAALAIGLWLQRGDPAMDDLAHPDVLSQMAAGEM